MQYFYYYTIKDYTFTIIADENAILELKFGKTKPHNALFQKSDIIKKAILELDEYFSGERKTFDVNLNPQGTEFQRKVWEKLREIPYGKTFSYKELAEMTGNIKASRAVGMANNKNPVPIFIPCHRVIGSNGNLVGYAGGLELKRELINMEKKYAND